MAEQRNWDIVQLAEKSAAARDWGDYPAIATREAARFQAETQLDASGLSYRLKEIEGDSGVVPPEPPTLRGRLGAVVVRNQQRLFWWVIRAFRLRDNALRSAYNALLQLSTGQLEREAQLREELRALQGRVHDLEKRLQ